MKFEILRHGSIFDKKSLDMGTYFSKRTLGCGYGFGGLSRTPPSDYNLSTPPGRQRADRKNRIVSKNADDLFIADAFTKLILVCANDPYSRTSAPY